jgi:hypothetical protein
VGFFVILCRMAARGDAAMTAPAVAHPHARTPRPGLTLWDERASTASRGSRVGVGELGQLGTGLRVAAAQRAPAAARGARARRPGCIAPS